MKDLSQLNSWHSNWSGLKAVVFGLGVSGFSVADTLAELGADVLVVAEKAEAELIDIIDVLGVEHVTGDAAKGVPALVVEFEPEILITSPGVKPENELLVWAREKHIPIWVDIDLAWRLKDKTEKVAEWILVTGTNGKTTTVQLATAMLNQGGIRAIACGNIGTPILDAIRDPSGFDALVIELSSFQLHYVGEVSPHTSVVLNLAEDHLDWHGSFNAYADAKAKVYENTRVTCIYNVNDVATEKLLENADVIEGARAIGFTTGMPSRSQVGFAEDILCDRAFLEDRATSALELATLEDLANIGVLTPHLMANTAAAAAIARSFDVAPADIRQAIREFRLDAHRIELVADHLGIKWLDDSKATNPHAAAASLNSFENIIWVAGGLLKGVDVAPLVAEYKDRLKTVLIIGKDRSALVDAISKGAPELPFFEIESEDVMHEVVAEAKKIAASGDVVLLAPAAASMDQFKDYADRGRKFAHQVKLQLGLM